MGGNKNAEYLVTGGAGFIGSNLVERLVRSGARVRVLDNLATGRMRNLDSVIRDIDFIEGDIRDKAIVGKATAGVRCVFHVGALPSVPRSIEEPVETCEVNVVGTLVILDAARAAGVGTVVFSSSSSVYGNTETLPKRENMMPNPASPYAVQKFACECYCRQYFEIHGLRTFALRYFNVFGPKQNPESKYAAVIPRFIGALSRNEPPTICGDGLQTRDFTFVDNVVSANIACAGASAEAAGQVYNVACGGRISVLDLARELMTIMGKEIEPVHVEPRPGDVRDSEGDIAKAERALGWRPETELRAGLERTVEYFTGLQSRR